MNTTKFWISSITAVATAGALGLAIAQTTEYKDQGGSTTGGAAAQEPAPAKSMSTDSGASTPSSASSSSDSSTGAQGASPSAPAAEQPMAKADRG